MLENQSLMDSIVVEGMLHKTLSYGIIGSSESLMKAVKQCIQVAHSEAPVMLPGSRVRARRSSPA